MAQTQENSNIKIECITANQANNKLHEDVVNHIKTSLEKGTELVVLNVQEGKLGEIIKHVNQLVSQLNQNTNNEPGYTCRFHSMKTITQLNRRAIRDTGIMTVVIAKPEVKIGLSERKEVRRVSNRFEAALFNQFSLSKWNKGGLVSTLNVSKGHQNIQMTLANVHLESKAASERFTDWRNVMMAVYGEKLDPLKDSSIEELKKRLNVIVAGDYNTRDIIGHDDATIKGIAATKSNKTDKKVLIPAETGLQLHYDEKGSVQKTYAHYDLDKNDPKRPGFRTTGVLDHVASSCVTAQEGYNAIHIPTKGSGYDHTVIGMNGTISMNNNIDQRFQVMVERAGFNNDASYKNYLHCTDTEKNKKWIECYNTLFAKGGKIENRLNAKIDTLKKPKKRRSYLSWFITSIAKLTPDPLFQWLTAMSVFVSMQRKTHSKGPIRPNKKP